jgi:cell wall-associated NlpC family hydrolase
LTTVALCRWLPGAALAWTLALPGAAAHAAPRIPSAEAAASAAGPDAVTRFLVDKGLIAAPTGSENSVVERLRDRASDMVITAMNFLGVPYKRGGNSADHGFDCSGFTRHVFELSLGLVLPRRADEQAQTAGLVDVKRNELKPGDLVFFNTLKRTFSHVGIYVGEGKFIHSPRAGGEVRVEDMGASYWAKRFTGARRADAAEAALAPNVAAAPAPAPARATVY